MSFISFCCQVPAHGSVDSSVSALGATRVIAHGTITKSKFVIQFGTKGQTSHRCPLTKWINFETAGWMFQCARDAWHYTHWCSTFRPCTLDFVSLQPFLHFSIWLVSDVSDTMSNKRRLSADGTKPLKFKKVKEEETTLERPAELAYVKMFGAWLCLSCSKEQ